MLMQPVPNPSAMEPMRELQERLARTWEELLATSRFVQTVQRGEVTKALYAIYMLETYHYTFHNARNQALVGAQGGLQNRHYQKFCFTHAAEEVGHEQMALHDVLSLGLKGGDFQLPGPLPETETLIAYLYWVSTNGNPVRRLGYSFWAEGCYQYVNPLIQKVRETLRLTPAQLTFFVAHAELDQEHLAEVHELVQKTCVRPEDWAAVGEVMETSLRLTGRMMDAAHDEYLALREQRSSRYAFLARL